MLETELPVINPTAEDAHWRTSFKREPYYKPDLGFDDYGPAYRVGYTAPVRRPPSVRWALIGLKANSGSTGTGMACPNGSTSLSVQPPAPVTAGCGSTSS